MSRVYADYTRARIGWFFGLTGWQVIVVLAASAPVWLSISAHAWASTAAFALVAGVLVGLTVIPVHGRSALGWLGTWVGFTVGQLAGWSRFAARLATGAGQDGDQPDLPGVLAGVEIHEGPPTGLAGSRAAVIQDHAARTWAVTAAVTHPGIGMQPAEVRDRMGAGLSDLLDQAAATDLVDEIVLIVRTVPEDGADRDQWVTRHRRPDGLAQVRAINVDLAAALNGGSVRTEAFITVVVPEAKLGRPARAAGRGLPARVAVLSSLMGEIEAQLRGGLGMTRVDWLTSPQLAVACRTGFAPGDRTQIVDALAATRVGSGANSDVPWPVAGPSGAQPSARYYSHDAWNSISATIRLAHRGAVIGAMAPILTPAHPGERRTLAVFYPVLSASEATRAAASAQWSADLGQALRDKARVRQTTKVADAAAQSRSLEAKAARGRSITQPYAVATVTTPKTARIEEAGRSLDAAIRSAGYAPLRLDLAQDVAFAASVVPLGVDLTRRSAQ